MRPTDIARLCSSHAAVVPGVGSAHTSVDRKHVKVHIESTGGDRAELAAAVDAVQHHEAAARRPPHERVALALAVAALLVLVAFPEPDIFEDAPLRYGVVIMPVYMISALAVGTWLLTDTTVNALRWATERRRPTIDDQRSTFMIPWRVAVVHIALWGGAAVLSTVLFGRVDAAFIPRFLGVLGIVGANKGWPARKGFAEMFAAVSVLMSRHPDVHLYVHSDIAGFQRPARMGDAFKAGVEQQLDQPVRRGVLDGADGADAVVLRESLLGGGHVGFLWNTSRACRRGRGWIGAAAAEPV